MSKKLYKPQKRFTKSNLTFIDKIEIAGITAATVILVGWSSWSIYDSIIPPPPIVTHNIYLDGISSHLNDVDNEMPVSQVKRLEEEQRKAEEEVLAEAAEKAAKEEEENKLKAEAEKEAEKKAANAIANATASAEARERAEAERNAITSSQYVIREAVRFRNKPDINSVSYGMCKPGEVLDVIEPETAEHKGWIKINHNGIDGYVSAEFVDKK